MWRRARRRLSPRRNTANNSPEAYFDYYLTPNGNNSAVTLNNSTFLETPGLVTRFDEAAVTTTPEPASLALLGTGLMGVAGITRRRRMRVLDA